MRRTLLHLWLRRSEAWAVVLAVVVVVVLTWQVVVGGTVVRLDHRLYGAFGPTQSWPVLAISDLGGIPVAAAVLAVVAIASAVVARRWWPVLLAAGNSLAISTVVLVLKWAVGRVGPGLAENPGGYPGFFPSGHTATAAVCLGTAAYVGWTTARRTAADVAGRCVLIGIATGGLVGTMTVVSASHWLSDVVAALAVSVVVLVAGFAVTRRQLASGGLSVGRRTLDV